MGMIEVWRGQFDTYLLVNQEDDRDILIQTDYDLPAIASTFGMAMCCDETDGTIACNHMAVVDHIARSREYLDQCVDNAKQVDDPGYFEELPDPHFNRFDICEAAYLFTIGYHVAGLSDHPVSGRDIEPRLHAVNFRPRPSLQSVDDLTENGQAIYTYYVRAWTQNERAQAVM